MILCSNRSRLISQNPPPVNGFWTKNLKKPKKTYIVCVCVFKYWIFASWKSPQKCWIKSSARERFQNPLKRLQFSNNWTSWEKRNWREYRLTIPTNNWKILYTTQEHTGVLHKQLSRGVICSKNAQIKSYDEVISEHLTGSFIAAAVFCPALFEYVNAETHSTVTTSGQWQTKLQHWVGQIPN